MGKIIKKSTANLASLDEEATFAEPAPTPARSAKIIDRDTVEARSDAQRIRERAQEEAQAILSNAEQQAEELRQRAHAEGLAQGRNDGAAELSDVIARASVRMQEIEEQVVPQLRDLAMKIAHKILGRELSQHPEAVADIVRQALNEKARQRRELVLRVHPDDIDYIRQAKPELLNVLSRAKEIEIREDPEVQRHGVIIETDAGSIDAQLETQLAVFERVLSETP